MTVVMAVAVGANAHADATNMDANNGSVGCAGAQQGERKNRGNEGFHSGTFGVRAYLFRRLGTDGRLVSMKNTKSRLLVPNRTK